MRAILIDPNTQKVSRITLEGPTLQALRDTIGCQLVTVHSLGTEVDLWLDDEGLLVDNPLLFEIEGASQAFAGRGVILGHDSEGNSIDCPDYVTAERLKDFVSFPEPSSLVTEELITFVPFN